MLSTLTAATLAGCASAPTECSANWYEIGQRDGRLGAAPQAGYYQAHCTSPIDRARYQSGWEDGYARRPLPLW